MDIQVSSNFERLLFEASRRDAGTVRRLMESLKQSGRFVLPDAVLAAVREEFDAGRADETETSAAIRAAWREAGDLVDPHTAVALAVADRDTTDSKIPNIVLSTAHAAKFPDAVEAACGVRPELPPWLDAQVRAIGRALLSLIERGVRRFTFDPHATWMLPVPSGTNLPLPR